MSSCNCRVITDSYDNGHADGDSCADVGNPEDINPQRVKRGDKSEVERLLQGLCRNGGPVYQAKQHSQECQEKTCDIAILAECPERAPPRHDETGRDGDGKRRCPQIGKKRESENAPASDEINHC